MEHPVGSKKVNKLNAMPKVWQHLREKADFHLFFSEVRYLTHIQ